MTNQRIDQDGVITNQTSSAKSYVVVRFKKQKEPQSIRVVTDHNKRARFFYEQGHEHAPGGGQLIARKNEKLWGPDTPEEVADLARSLIRQHAVKKLRKDAVRAVEVLLSLSPGHGIDDTVFFTDSMHWFAQRFGGMENLLAADIHRDETHDHVHMLFLPVLDGRMVGSQMVGGRGKIKGCKLSFNEEICRQYGVRVLMVDSLSRQEKAIASRAVQECLVAARDPVSTSLVWDAVRTSIENQPEPYLPLLGMSASMFRQDKARSNTRSISLGTGLSST
jgi:hypothetical protein